MADIFLSHSSEDNDAARTIRERLSRDRKSWSVFLDLHRQGGIQAGQDWQDRLRRELQSCRLVLAIITPSWLASRWCFTEAVTANFRGKDFVAVLPRPLPDGALDVAPPIVHQRQRLPLDLENEHDWDNLLRGLDQSGLDPNQWFPIPEGVGPYPGFVAFEEKDAGVFFGRDQEITEYLAALNTLRARDRAQALVISGGCGIGKSSLLKAGLIPRLRQRPDWKVIRAFDPSREPIHALFAAMRKTPELEVDLPSEPPPTADALADLLETTFRKFEERVDDNVWLLLPFDQAEVLLAGGKSGQDGKSEAKSEGARLLTAIGQLLASRRRRLIAAFTIRTEFIPALQRALPPGVDLDHRSLRPITALTDVIEKPASRVGVGLGEGLATRMVADTRGADALPLLAYTLRELYERYGRDDRRLDLDEYGKLGGVRGAIERKLKEALSDSEPEELVALRRAFVRQLVRVDESAVEDERFFRRAVPRESLPEEARRLIERLREARLLVDHDHGKTISIAHERLIGNWEGVPLRNWLAEHSDDHRLIDSLKSRLAEHQQGGPFLSQKPLRDAEDLLARDAALESDEPDLARFIQESLEEEKQAAKEEGERQRREVEQARKLAEPERLRAEEQAKASQRNRWLAIAAGVAALLSAGAGIFAYDRMQVATTEKELARKAQEDAERQAAVAKRRRDEAFRNESLFRTEQSHDALARGLPVTAMQLALAGLPQDPDAADARPWLPEPASALVEAMGQQRELLVLRGHKGPVSAAGYSPDGARIVSGSGSIFGEGDNTVRVWDASSGAELLVMRGHEGDVSAAGYSPDGARIVSGSFDKTVRVWDAASGAQLSVLRGHEGSVRAAGYSPDGARIVSGSHDKTVRVWDAATGAELLVLRGHEASVRAVAYSPDGARIVSGSGSIFGEADDTVRVWDASSGAELLVLRGHDGSVRAVAYSPDGARIVSGALDNTVRVWDATSGAELLVLRGHEGAVRAVAYSPDGAQIVSGSSDHTVRVWDAASGAELLVLRGHEGSVRAVAYSPDGARIVSGSSDKTARMWDAASRAELLVLRGHEGDVWAAGYSPDGGRIVSGASDNTVRVWDAASGAELLVLRGHEGDVLAAGYSPDGRRIVSGSGSIFGEGDDTVRVWDAAGGAELLVLRGHERGVWAAGYSPDGARIVSGSRDDTVRVWDAASGAELLALHGHDGYVLAAGYSPDGTRIVSGSGDGTVRVWDAASGAELLVLRGHEGYVLAAGYSPDGARIVSGSDDDTVRVWDASSGAELLVLRAHEGDVWAAGYSPDGARVVSGSGDTVRVWDAVSGAELLALRGHEGDVLTVGCSPDGARIVSGSSDNTVRVTWVPRTKQELIETARARLPRELTDDERRRFYLAPE